MGAELAAGLVFLVIAGTVAALLRLREQPAAILAAPEPASPAEEPAPRAPAISGVELVDAQALATVRVLVTMDRRWGAETAAHEYLARVERAVGAAATEAAREQRESDAAVCEQRAAVAREPIRSALEGAANEIRNGKE